jgi:hypothetical protein
MNLHDIQIHGDRIATCSRTDGICRLNKHFRDEIFPMAEALYVAA